MKRKTRKRKEATVVFALALALFAAALFIMREKVISILLSPQFAFGIVMPASIGVKTDSVNDQTAPVMASTDEHQDEHNTPKPTEESGGGMLQLEEDVPDSIRIELLDEQGSQVELGGREPRVLIYHTHTTEAYTMTPGKEYVETSKWRTAQHERSIVAVGELLASELRKKGINVIHDVTDHEPPKLSSSYSRSLVTMEKMLAKYPSINLFIDVHRDAAGASTVDDYVEIDGKHVARIMFVVGTGEGKTGAGFDVKPDFKANYALAKTITENLAAVNKKLIRPIRVKTGRYNQHLPGRSLLAEIGHNANTLDEALNAVPYLADAIVKAAKQSPSLEKNGD